jgi:ssDNA-binding Zn-finger/Zn-ribbon topoisomerase 1
MKNISYPHYPPLGMEPASPPTDYLCPACGCDRHKREIMGNESKHYAAARCVQCNSFLKWLPNPQNQEKRDRRSRLIGKWLANPKLNINHWERSFLSSIQKLKSLSPKQSENFEKIYARLGGAL